MYACWKIRDLDLVKKYTDHYGEEDSIGTLSTYNI